MMLKLLFVCALADACGVTRAQATHATSPPVRPPVNIDAMAWLAGCRAGNNGHAEFHEQWMKPADGMMLGMSRTLVDGKITTYESMRIHTLVDGSIALTPNPSG